MALDSLDTHSAETAARAEFNSYPVHVKFRSWPDTACTKDQVKNLAWAHVSDIRSKFPSMVGEAYAVHNNDKLQFNLLDGSIWLIVQGFASPIL